MTLVKMAYMQYQASNFVLEGARPFCRFEGHFHVCKGDFHWENHEVYGNFKGASRPRPGATEAMVFVTSGEIEARNISPRSDHWHQKVMP